MSKGQKVNAQKKITNYFKTQHRVPLLTFWCTLFQVCLIGNKYADTHTHTLCTHTFSHMSRCSILHTRKADALRAKMWAGLASRSHLILSSWVNHWRSLSLSFLMSKMRTILPLRLTPNTQGAVGSNTWKVLRAARHRTNAPRILLIL